jgi:predicted esterase
MAKEQFFSINHLLSAMLLAAIFFQNAADAEVVTKWTNPEGKVIEAEFVEMTDQHVSIKLKGQKTPTKIPHEKLSAKSLEEARRLSSEKKDAEKKLGKGTEGKFKLAEHWIPRGKKTEVMVDIPAGQAVKFLSESYGKPTTKVIVNLIVPEKFDPADKDSLVVFCHAPYGNGRGLSVKDMATFQKVALEENALVVAVDGELGNPGQKETPTFRSFLVYSMLEALAKDHPSTQWRYVHAGNSGGSGYASYASMYMIENSYRVVGCYLGVGNYSPLQWDKYIKLKTAQKKKLRLYYSFGENDKVCPKALQDKMLAELKPSPYSSVRVSYHKKGHGFDEAHWKEAFQWFKEPP